MRRVLAICGLVALVVGCAPRPAPPEARALVFLTRDGCAMSDRLRTNLDAALRSLKTPMTYQVIDESTLSRNDPRSAYPTPTLLYAGRDLFGMAEPVSPFPEPT